MQDMVQAYEAGEDVPEGFGEAMEGVRTYLERREEKVGDWVHEVNLVSRTHFTLLHLLSCASWTWMTGMIPGGKPMLTSKLAAMAKQKDTAPAAPSVVEKTHDTSPAAPRRRYRQSHGLITPVSSRHTSGSSMQSAASSSSAVSPELATKAGTKRSISSSSIESIESAPRLRHVDPSESRAVWYPRVADDSMRGTSHSPMAKHDESWNSNGTLPLLPHVFGGMGEGFVMPKFWSFGTNVPWTQRGRENQAATVRHL